MAENDALLNSLPWTESRISMRLCLQNHQGSLAKSKGDSIPDIVSLSHNSFRNPAWKLQSHRKGRWSSSLFFARYLSQKHSLLDMVLSLGQAQEPGQAYDRWHRGPHMDGCRQRSRCRAKDGVTCGRQCEVEEKGPD